MSTKRTKQIEAMQQYLRYNARAAIEADDTEHLDRLRQLGWPRDLVDGAKVVAQALNETAQTDRPWAWSNQRGDQVLAKFVTTLDSRQPAPADGSAVAEAVQRRQRGGVLVSADGSVVLESTGMTSREQNPDCAWRQ